MSNARRRSGTRVVVLTMAGALLVASAEVALVLGARSALDRQQYVSDPRLDSAMRTFRPEPHPGLSRPLDARAFGPDRNPRTEPASCGPLTALADGTAADGRSWTGAGDGTPVPVTLLTLRFADADAARAELDRKRLALLRCSRVEVTFPPFDAPATSYDVSGRHLVASALGRTVRWTLDGGGRRFDFYVVRYGNTLTWTYDDDQVSTPTSRERTADDLVDELQDLASR